MSALLQLKDVCKTYQQGKIAVHALNHVDLDIQRGEFTALVGPSGSGKTTLLNVIGSLDKASSGEILLEGNDIATIPAKDLADFRLHKIGFIFQAYNLIPVLNALENVELIMVLQGKHKTEYRTQAQNYLKLVGLQDYMHRKPGELSGGQQQRVAVARALAAEPHIVLADEPTANLDSENAESLLDLMYKLAKEKDITFVFSTHDPRVMEKARRIITLRDGKIIDDKTKT